MDNCQEHLCPFLQIGDKARICPVGWTLDRFRNNTVKDVLYEDELLELVFNDGISLTAYRPAVRVEQGHWSFLELDADGFLEIFTGARVHEVAYVFDDPNQGIYYLQLGLGNDPADPLYRVVIEFSELSDQASIRIIHFIGGSNGKK
jgi:hypothetical protein